MRGGVTVMVNDVISLFPESLSSWDKWGFTYKCWLKNDFILGIGWNGWQFKWVCLDLCDFCCSVLQCIWVLRMKAFVLGFLCCMLVF